MVWYNRSVETIVLDLTPPDLWRELVHWTAYGYRVVIAPRGVGRASIAIHDGSRCLYARSFSTLFESADVARALGWARVLVLASALPRPDQRNASHGAIDQIT